MNPNDPSSPTEQQIPPPTPQPSVPPHDPQAPFTPTPGSVPGQNNYDFILNPPASPPKKLFGGNQALKLLLLVGGIGIVLVITLMVILSLLRPGTPTTGVVGIVQRQQEIIRIAGEGERTAQAEDLKGLAYTIDLSIRTSQDQAIRYLSGLGTKIPPKEFALKRDAATDTLLTNAKTTSTYDTALRTVLSDQLNVYLKELQDEYKKANGPNLKKLLNDSFVTGKTLLDRTQANE